MKGRPKINISIFTILFRHTLCLVKQLQFICGHWPVNIHVHALLHHSQTCDQPLLISRRSSPFHDRGQ